MTNEQMDQYKYRITQAGIGDLTVIMHEMEMQWMEEALVAYKEQDIDSFVDCVEKAQVVQKQLMDVLNLDNKIAQDVYAIYIYINKQLITAKIKKQPLDLLRCKEILAKFHKSFLEVAKTDEEGPIMVGSEKIYAGLTYGSSGLVENSTGGMEFSV